MSGAVPCTGRCICCTELMLTTRVLRSAERELAAAEKELERVRGAQVADCHVCGTSNPPMQPTFYCESCTAIYHDHGKAIGGGGES